MVLDMALTGRDKHTVQFTDDVLQKCAPETCRILVTSVTPTNSKKGKKKYKIPERHFIKLNILFLLLLILGKE